MGCGACAGEKKKVELRISENELGFDDIGAANEQNWEPATDDYFSADDYESDDDSEPAAAKKRSPLYIKSSWNPQRVRRLAALPDEKMQFPWWCPGDETKFRLRGVNYLKGDKRKQQCTGGCPYEVKDVFYCREPPGGEFSESRGQCATRAIPGEQCVDGLPTTLVLVIKLPNPNDERICVAIEMERRDMPATAQHKATLEAFRRRCADPNGKYKFKMIGCEGSGKAPKIVQKMVDNVPIRFLDYYTNFWPNGHVAEFVVNFEAYDWIFKVTWNAAIALIPNAVFNLILTMEGIDDDSLPESALACFLLHPYGFSQGDDYE